MASDSLLSAAAAHFAAGRIDQAGALADSILSEAPAQPDALRIAALVALRRGQKDEAVALLRRAVAAAPDRPLLHNDLGAALRLAGRPREAAESFTRAIGLNEANGEAWHNLGLTRRALGDLSGAAEALQKAVAIAPRFAPAHNALGVVLAALGQADAARAAFLRAVELAPDYAEALSNGGLALHHAGEAARGLAMLEKAIALKPGLADAWFNLGVVRQGAGDFDGANEAWRRTLAIDPGNGVAHSNLLYALHYEAAWSGEALLKEARGWGARHGRPAGRFQSWANDRNPDRRLRIGYVSPDFRTHSCAHFLRPLLAAHGRDAVEIFAYAELTKRDAATAEFQRLADHWRETAGRDAAAIAEQIRKDGIDILLDLAGHSSGNRLDVFALKPAPVQVTWLGYPGSTGLATIDYRLTDLVADPQGAEAQASETLWRLPRGFHCWQAPGAPAIAPRADSAPITFGSFNNIQKVTPQVVALWAQILRAVPEARLFLKSHWLSRPRARERVAAAFIGQGIGPERIRLSGWTEPEAHLATYGAMDIALDPFPYNGTTTTLEALWMGVPVITLAGDRHSGRVGESLLRQIGAEALIAASPAEYVQAAVALARDPARLAAYRSGLRAQLSTSPLMDGAGFARAIEDAYRAMWRRWCAAP